ncbi:MAG: 4-hydroxythreonine-4-phosphate dehydrogenase PdxA [Paracoccaceae bacterium]
MNVAPIALTCGEPAGIGPEIAVAAWRALGPDLPFFWIGDPAHLPPGTPLTLIDRPDQARATHGLPVLAHPFPAPATPGRPDPRNAQAVIDVIARAVALVADGEAGAICTAPINKQALVEGAGFTFPGHTEYLAALAGVGRVVMMLAAPGLRVVPVTIHIPLADVPHALSPALLEETITITADALQRDFAIAAPRLAVAGLNPHAGEGGTMGREEIDLITPTLNHLRARGFDIAGPLPADTMFHPAARARYDVAICMYHDQALIPIKTVDFAGGVNITLGLPFVRSSPDHGTAFDIAGKGRADPTSLIAALRMAHDMAATRTRRSLA